MWRTVQRMIGYVYQDQGDCGRNGGQDMPRAVERKGGIKFTDKTLSSKTPKQ